MTSPGSYVHSAVRKVKFLVASSDVTLRLEPPRTPQSRRLGSADGRLQPVLEAQKGPPTPPCGPDDRSPCNPPGTVGLCAVDMGEVGDGIGQAHQDQGRTPVGMEVKIVVIHLDRVKFRTPELRNKLEEPG